MLVKLCKSDYNFPKYLNWGQFRIKVYLQLIILLLYFCFEPSLLISRQRLLGKCAKLPTLWPVRVTPAHLGSICDHLRPSYVAWTCAADEWATIWHSSSCVCISVGVLWFLWCWCCIFFCTDNGNKSPVKDDKDLSVYLWWHQGLVPGWTDWVCLHLSATRKNPS